MIWHFIRRDLLKTPRPNPKRIILYPPPHCQRLINSHALQPKTSLIDHAHSLVISVIQMEPGIIRREISGETENAEQPQTKIFTTELLRHRLMAERHQAATTSKVRSLIPTCFTGFNPVGDLRLNVEMGSKIKEISRRLDNISTRQAKLGLKMDLGVGHGWERFASGRRASTWERPPTTSLMNEAVQGRDKERKDIVDLLLKDEAGESNFGVLPIVGIGGTGKTTLAQLVCKDEGIMKHFDPIAWVCISEECDVVKISEAILRALSHNQSTDLKDFNKVQQTLEEILTRKKFLLVLDDVWNINHDEQWNTLQTPFKYGEKGSKIIITTRDANVARTMRAYDSRYTLQPLSDDDCWSLFVKHACETENIHVRQNLVLREKVTKWCGGLPLAAKVLGGLLRSKLHDHSWEDLLKNEIWRLPSEKRDILQVLRLSYHHLPSHLKRCFGYCAMFPKDYEFEKKELILLWIAEGLIHQSEGGRHQMEDLGANYFDELLSRSFFQSSSNDKSRFVMHDLINDLAQDVAQELYFNLEDNEKENDKICIVSERTRHSSFIRSKSDVFKRFEVFNKMEHLRTLVALPISMKDKKFFLTTKVFDDLLPKLRHLRFIVGKQKRSGIKELKNLLNLRGNLFISDLHNIMNTRDAKEVDLKGRHDIEQLRMKWSNDFGDSRNESNELENPFPSLESLGFDNMPKWKDWKERESSFPCLGKLTIKKCPELINLPSQLLSLVKKLHIDECQKLEVNKYNRGLLETLETLKINQCDELAFLGLQSLGSLQHLEIRSCDGVVSLEEQKLPGNLQRLEVEGCSNLEKLPNALGSLTFLTNCALQYLYIEGCPSLRRFPEGELSTTLKLLRIFRCESLESLPEASMGLRNLISLKILVLSSCPELGSVVPKEGLPPTLAELTIIDCPILKKRCLKDKGKDWLKIAHIPKVVIDGIIQQSSMPDS
ncbi:unnamed protein product, partial [Vitis vinifera]